MLEHFQLRAKYNTWMNDKVYKTAGELSDAQLREDRGAFFKSVLGSLNHLIVADRVWLRRFAEHPAARDLLADVVQLPKPTALDEILYDDLAALSAHRVQLDQRIEQMMQGFSTADLDEVLSFTNMRGEKISKRLSGLLLHFFNHQTHHRGQVTTLLSQFGKDVGVTDLFVLVLTA